MDLDNGDNQRILNQTPMQTALLLYRLESPRDGFRRGEWKEHEDKMYESIFNIIRDNMVCRRFSLSLLCTHGVVHREIISGTGCKAHYQRFKETTKMNGGDFLSLARKICATSSNFTGYMIRKIFERR